MLGESVCGIKSHLKLKSKIGKEDNLLLLWYFRAVVERNDLYDLYENLGMIVVQRVFQS